MKMNSSKPANTSLSNTRPLGTDLPQTLTSVPTASHAKQEYELI